MTEYSSSEKLLQLFTTCLYSSTCSSPIHTLLQRHFINAFKQSVAKTDVNQSVVLMCTLNVIRVLCVVGGGGLTLYRIVNIHCVFMLHFVIHLHDNFLEFVFIPLATVRVLVPCHALLQISAAE